MGTVKYSGPIASFHCPTEATIRSLKVHFSPKQLGEGDPSPENVREIVGWDGVEVRQSGKNLYSIEKVRAHGHEDWDTIMAGKKGKVSTSNYNRWTFIDTAVPKAKYTYLPNCYEVGFLDAEENVLNNYMGWNKYVITAPDNACYIYLTWYKNGTNTAEAAMEIHNQMYLTFSNTTIENSDYEPYLGSTTNYEFGVLGKNKFPLRASNQFLDTSTGNSNTIARDMTTGDVYVNISSNNYWQGKSSTRYGISIGDGSVSFHTNDNSYGIGIFAPVLPNTTYTLSHSSFGGKTRVGYYNADGQHLNVNLSKDTDVITFTTSSETAFILVVFCSTSGSDSDYTVSNIQLEFGSTATTYEPYDPNKTVYGGWVDLVNGEVQQKYNKIIFDGSFNPGIFPWAADTEDEDGTIITHALYLKRDTYDNRHKRDAEAYCDQLQWYNINNVRNKIGFGMYDGSSYSACLMLPKELVGDTNETLNSYLSANPITIVSELETPITYNLPPHSAELKTFLSHNNVWSNADYVEVEYDLHETQTILARKQFIVANQPHVEKLAAAPLQNFVTDMVAPLKECKVHFAPVQEGTGDPSPDNIRPISGWTGLEVTRCGKNFSTAATGTEMVQKWPIISSGSSRTLELSGLEPGQEFTLFASFTKASEPSSNKRLYLVGSQKTNTTSNTIFYGPSADGPRDAVIHNWVDTDGTIRITHNNRGLTYNDDFIEYAASLQNIQLEVGDTATTFEPYNGTTIPITFPSVTNLLNSTTITTNKTLSAAGEEISETGMSLTNYIKVNEGDTYKLTFTSKEGARTRRIYGYDANKEPVESLASASWVSVDSIGTLTTTIPSGVEYIRVCYKTADENIFLEGPESSVIYGGYVDLVNGELVQTYYSLLVDGINVVANRGQYKANGYYGGAIVYLSPEGLSAKYKNGQPTNVWCDTLPLYIGVNTIPTTPHLYMPLAGAAYAVFYLINSSENPEYEGDSSAVINYTNNWLQEHPTTIVYELSTPIHYSLTPTQLKTLRGTNNIWSNAGDITLSYWEH